MRFRPPPSAQGYRAWRAECSARARAARAAFVRRRRIAIPATTSSWAVLDAGGKGAGSSLASVRSASSMRPIRRRRRTSRCRACAAFTRSPCSSSVARAASSAFAGQPRSRETSAISASATTHLARATASFGPKARAALSQESLRSNEIAELRHRDASKRERRPRRRARRPASMRRVDHLRERTRRSRDQRVHRNPATLVTPTVLPALNLSHDQQPPVESSTERNKFTSTDAAVRKGAVMASNTSRTMIAALQVSLDGFIQGPNGEKDWVDSWAARSS